MPHAFHPPAGFWPVMLTPFTDRGNIDWPAYDELIEWYLRAGAAGLFASCLSSEFFHLLPQERLELARRAVQRVQGRVPVIAAGPLGPDLSQMADCAKALADEGVAAVICLTNQFHSSAPDNPAAQAAWQKNMETWLSLLPESIPLGIYEAPRPFAYNLPAAVLGWLAASGRFFMTKDTCCDNAVITEKLAQTAASPLRFYNADVVTLLSSLRAGGNGYSGIAGNYYGHLFAWLCARFEQKPELAGKLSAFFAASSPTVHHKYMASAKIYLARNGLRLTPHTRAVQHSITAEDTAALDKLHNAVREFETELQLPGPF